MRLLSRFSVLAAALSLCVEPVLPEETPVRVSVGASLTGNVFFQRAGSDMKIRDLSQVVVYLVPDGHEVALKLSGPNPSVSQKNAKFFPSLVVAVKGETMEFPNDDDIEHNVFSFSPVKPFDLGIYPKGAMKTVALDNEGPVTIFCSIHENMSGVIFVVPNPFYAVTDSRGRFTVAQVPAGKYFLRTWHPTLPELSKAIVITPVQAATSQALPMDLNLAQDLWTGEAP